MANHYSFRAKVEFDTERYEVAMNDLEIAMRQDFDNADKMFDSPGTKPDSISPNICAWTLSNLDLLVQKFPHDYRALLFRGLYLKFFVVFDEKAYQKAFENFQKAAMLNPKSPLPHFYMGALAGTILSPKLTKLSNQQRQGLRSEAILHYTRAIQLDAGFLPAYEQRSGGYLGLKQYPQAIKDYNKVLELDPENLVAYADRGLAKAELGEYSAAISDYDEVIRKAAPDYRYLGDCYEKRASAHMKIGDDAQAISDFTKAIELELGSQGFLFSLGQFRALYPEYDGISDEEFCRKLNKLFWPQYEYSVFEKHLAENKGEWAISELNELYEQRGDAYLRAGEFKKSVSDFNRILRAIPIFGAVLERWRMLGLSPGGEQNYLDVKTVEFSLGGSTTLWLKTVEKNGRYTVRSYEIDCKSKSLRMKSAVQYGANDEAVRSSDDSGEWQGIVPDTLGEQLYGGMCSEH
jgi:tetratricopeptide (TPR) repeat protein